MVSFSQMSGFSSFPQFWLLSCSWEQWVILLQYGYGVWGHFLLLSFLAGFCTACGARDLHARTTLLHSSAFYARIFAMLSRTLALLDKTRNSHFRFFYLSSSSHRRARHRIRERGVGVWIWEEISRKALATSSTSQWIPSLRLMDSPTFLSISRSACFGDLHASTSAHQDQ